MVALFHQAGLRSRSVFAWLGHRAATDPRRPSLHVVLDDDAARRTFLRELVSFPTEDALSSTAERHRRPHSLIDAPITLTRRDGSRWNLAHLRSEATSSQLGTASGTPDLHTVEQAGLSLLGHAVLIGNRGAVRDLLLVGANWAAPLFALLSAGVLSPDHTLIVDPFLWLSTEDADRDVTSAMANYGYPSQFATIPIEPGQRVDCGSSESFVRLIGVAMSPERSDSIVSFEPVPARFACNGAIAQSDGSLHFAAETQHAVVRRRIVNGGLEKQFAWLTVRERSSTGQEWMHYIGEYDGKTNLFRLRRQVPRDNSGADDRANHEHLVLVEGTTEVNSVRGELSFSPERMESMLKTIAVCGTGDKHVVQSNRLYITDCTQVETKSVHILFRSSAPYLVAIKETEDGVGGEEGPPDPPVRYLIATDDQARVVLQKKRYAILFSSLSGIRPFVEIVHVSSDTS